MAPVVILLIIFLRSGNQRVYGFELIIEGEMCKDLKREEPKGDITCETVEKVPIQRFVFFIRIKIK